MQNDEPRRRARAPQVKERIPECAPAPSWTRAIRSQADARCWKTTGEAETRQVGKELAAEVGASGVLLLFGGMGAGKTVLAKGVAEAVGVPPGVVQSPTFTVIHEYQGSADEAGEGLEQRRLLHVDLYRLEPREIRELGLEEALFGPGIKVVEWAERCPRLWAELWPALWPLLERLGSEVELSEALEPEQGAVVGTAADVACVLLRRPPTEGVRRGSGGASHPAGRALGGADVREIICWR